MKKKSVNPINLKFKQLFFSDLIPGSLLITYHKTVTFNTKNKRTFETFTIQKIQLILSLHNGLNKTISIRLDPDAYMKTFILFESKCPNYLFNDSIYKVKSINILDFLQSSLYIHSIHLHVIN